MKKLTFIFSLVLISSFILSCNGSSDKGSSDSTDVVEKAVKEASGGKVSAEKWGGKLDLLLTKDMAAQVLGLDASEAEEDYDKSISSMQSITYSWENGRIGEFKIGGSIKKIPTADRITLRDVDNSSLEHFKGRHHAPTKEELSYLDDALDKKAEDGEISEEEAAGAKDLGAGLSGLLNFTEIDNVGDYTVWNSSTSELSTYYKGIEFCIHTNVSNDEEYNKEKAIEAARLIIKEKL